MATQTQLAHHFFSVTDSSKALSSSYGQRAFLSFNEFCCLSGRRLGPTDKRKAKQVVSSVFCSIQTEDELNENRHSRIQVISRRDCSSLLAFTAVSPLLVSAPASARERRKPKDIPDEDYKTASNGLKYYDFLEGKGDLAEEGMVVSVHFDCIYKTLTVVSSRESKLLGGNRIIAQPYDFVVGSKPGAERKKEYVESSNGLFSAQAAPKPPRALYSMTEGMRVGGKRTVLVPPEEGFGARGIGEIPPGATFEMNIELLEIKKV